MPAFFQRGQAISDRTVDRRKIPGHEADPAVFGNADVRDEDSRNPHKEFNQGENRTSQFTLLAVSWLHADFAMTN